MENKLRCFQYKVVHKILPTNTKLYKMKLRTFSSSDRCSHPHENLLHLLYECPRTQFCFFWQTIISWWKEKKIGKCHLKRTDILYGYKPDLSICLALNHYVIIAKYHTFLSWLNKASPSFEIFSLLLNEKILCERAIAFKNNTLKNLQSKMDNTMRMSCDKYVRLEGYATSILFSFFIFIYVLLISYNFSLVSVLALLKKQCIER